jgi:hypothetical protein
MRNIYRHSIKLTTLIASTRQDQVYVKIKSIFPVIPLSNREFFLLLEYNVILVYISNKDIITTGLCTYCLLK